MANAPVSNVKAETTPRPVRTVGFIGLGVMGEPMCRNLARKMQETAATGLYAFDLREEPVARLAEDGAQAASSPRALAAASDLVFLSLPSGKQVAEVMSADGGIREALRPGSIVVDLSTTPVALTRDLARELDEGGIAWVDAPIARTRQAAEDGTLAIMVGGADAAVAIVEPFLRCFATDITRCGAVGAGQIVKILNNLVLFQTIQGISEALNIARANGLEGEVLFDAFQKGSADSFALRNHGLKALLPGTFPEQAFSVAYARKDLAYALDLAHEAGLDAAGARAVDARFAQAIEQGAGDRYWPVIGETMTVTDKG